MVCGCCRLIEDLNFPKCCGGGLIHSEKSMHFYREAIPGNIMGVCSVFKKKVVRQQQSNVTEPEPSYPDSVTILQDVMMKMSIKQQSLKLHPCFVTIIIVIIIINYVMIIIFKEQSLV